MNRPDGVRVKNARLTERFGPYLLRSKQEGLLFYRQTVCVDATFDWIETHNLGVGKKEYTFFGILLTAMARIAPEFPQLGRFVVGKRIYQRKEISFSFVMRSSSEEGSKNAWVKVRFTGKEKLIEVARILDSYKKKLRTLSGDTGGESDKSLRFLFSFPPFLRPLVFRCAHLLNWMNLLPRKMIEADPMFSACIIANVGSVGLNPPYHHLFEWGTTSLFMSVGAAYPLACPHPEKGVVFRRMVDIHYTADQRTSFGTFSTGALERLQYFLEHPQELE